MWPEGAMDITKVDFSFNVSNPNSISQEIHYVANSEQSLLSLKHQLVTDQALY